MKEYWINTFQSNQGVFYVQDYMHESEAAAITEIIGLGPDHSVDFDYVETLHRWQDEAGNPQAEILDMTAACEETIAYGKAEDAARLSQRPSWE